MEITFQMICVSFVICLAIVLLTGLWCIFVSDSMDDPFGIGLIVNGLGFGICLTIILYQNGIIK